MFSRVFLTYTILRHGATTPESISGDQDGAVYLGRLSGRHAVIGQWTHRRLVPAARQSKGGSHGDTCKTLKLAVLPAALAVAPCSPLGAVAQDYPDRPITLVVPTAAGGGVDTQARALAPDDGRCARPARSGRQSRAGAGGTVGIQSLVLPADPDGYTIAASASVSLIENPILQGLAYGPEDLTIIGTTGQFQVAIVASARRPL